MIKFIIRYWVVYYRPNKSEIIIISAKTLSLWLLAVTNILQTWSRITCRWDWVNGWLDSPAEWTKCLPSKNMGVHILFSKANSCQATPSSAAKGKTNSFIASSLNYAVCRKPSKQKELSVGFWFFFFFSWEKIVISPSKCMKLYFCMKLNLHLFLH